jgi:formylglycine-generating enzyme required for sulfatase activity
MSVAPAGSWVRGLAVLPATSLLAFTAATRAGSEDCNNNGIPDAAEIAAGLADDCNANGIPDPCEYAGVSAEGETGPFGDGNPLIVTIADAAPAVSDLRLSIEVRADLDAIGEFVQAFVGDMVVATLWVSGGQACLSDPQMQTVMVPMATVNAAIDANGGDLVVSLEASGVVGEKECPDSFSFVAIDYVGDLAAADCLGNGVWDGCEIAVDPSLDCDANGVIDGCEIEWDPGIDCDGNGLLDVCDLAADPSLDCDGNGRVDYCEMTVRQSLDCDRTGILDRCEIVSDTTADCNGNLIPDTCEVAADWYFDCDCDGDGVPDTCQIDANAILDKNDDGILDSCQYARGDFDLNREVGPADLALQIGLWGTHDSPICDLNGDGLVNGEDLGILLIYWGPYSGPWGVVLEQEPDPLIIAKMEWRERLTATGLPWRVLDKASGIEMLLIPPGTFTMGCSPSNLYGCFGGEYPVHEVTLTKPFYLGRYEVTQSQWTAVMGTNPSWFHGASAEVPASQVAKRPVERVSWNMIQGFEAATGLRLPTEAEWEYACRAGTQTAFNLPPDGTNDDWLVGQLAWIGINSASQTRPVGQKQPNHLGLHDMHGNVNEFVEDWYASDYYAQSPAADPGGPTGGSFRVFRGGHWEFGFSFARSSNRSSTFQHLASYFIGFRAARTP